MTVAIEPGDDAHIADLARRASEPSAFPSVPADLMEQLPPGGCGDLFVQAHRLWRYYPTSVVFFAKLAPRS